jgi:hypothetical protein
MWANSPRRDARFTSTHRRSDELHCSEKLFAGFSFAGSRLAAKQWEVALPATGASMLQDIE